MLRQSFYQCTNPYMPPNHGKWWNSRERRTVRDMRHQGFTYGAIARKLGRTTKSVRMMHDQLRGF